MSYYKQVVVNKLAMDYITLVSRDRAALRSIADTLFRQMDEPLPKERRAGGGWLRAAMGVMHIAENARWGEGSSDILQVPGLLSELAARLAGDGNGAIGCSRFDIQLTVPSLEMGYDLELFGKTLQSDKLKWNLRGKPPKVTFIRDDKGRCTVYIGSRKSDVLLRVYNKMVGEQLCIRFEAEVKSRLCKTLWESNDITDGSVMAMIFRYCFSKLPDVYSLPLFDMIGENNGDYSYERQISDEERTLEWIQSTVLPTIRRLSKGKYSYELHRVLIDAIEANWYREEDTRRHNKNFEEFFNARE